jgi:protocatechuate 4,5-dioxygenase alpha chain
MMLDPPRFDLEEPGTFLFSGPRASLGLRLNRFALSLKRPANRERFLAAETDYMAEYGLTAHEMELVAARDWTGMLEGGGHLQAILKLAATVGLNLYHIGAHNCGIDFETMFRACPRKVTAGNTDG